MTRVSGAMQLGHMYSSGRHVIDCSCASNCDLKSFTEAEWYVPKSGPSDYRILRKGFMGKVELCGLAGALISGVSSVKI
jgi:hypothetical protein